MQTLIRYILIIGGLLMLALAAGYWFQQPWATRTWLWPDSPLSYTFMAAMQAAIATAMLWIGFSGELSVIAAGALNLVVMMGGLTFSFMVLAGQPAFAFLQTYAFVCALFALLNLALFFWSRRLPGRTVHLTPWPVRISYVIFIIFLLAVGMALVFRMPNVLPWKVIDHTQTPPRDDSVVFGWMFLGDAFYFLYALLYPQWRNACAPLWSFLAYDLILIGPFLNALRVNKISPELRNSMYIYLAVLFYSGLLALYYLLINPPDRHRAKQRKNFYELQV